MCRYLTALRARLKCTAPGAPPLRHQRSSQSKGPLLLTSGRGLMAAPSASDASKPWRLRREAANNKCTSTAVCNMCKAPSTRKNVNVDPDNEKRPRAENML